MRLFNNVAFKFPLNNCTPFIESPKIKKLIQKQSNIYNYFPPLIIQKT